MRNILGDANKPEDLLLLAKTHFERAQHFFTQIGDRANVGLVLGNTGRLCRIWAHLIGVQSDPKSANSNKHGDIIKQKDEDSEQSAAKENDGAVSSMEKSYYYKVVNIQRTCTSWYLFSLIKVNNCRFKDLFGNLHLMSHNLAKKKSTRLAHQNVKVTFKYRVHASLNSRYANSFS